jgi:hypothetical protein
MQTRTIIRRKGEIVVVARSHLRAELVMKLAFGNVRLAITARFNAGFDYAQPSFPLRSNREAGFVHASGPDVIRLTVAKICPRAAQINRFAWQNSLILRVTQPAFFGHFSDLP